MKILVISRSFPPHVGGMATTMGNLFRQFPRGSYVVLNEKQEPVDPGSLVDCKLFSMKLWIGRLYLGAGLAYGYAQYFFIPLLTYRAVKIINDEKSDSIFAVYPSGTFLISAFLAHKITRRPLYVYMHDTWEEGMDHVGSGKIGHKVIGKVFERMIFHSASRIFAISDALGELLSKKHGIDIITLPHCIDVSGYLSDKKQRNVRKEKSFEIVFCGSIYYVNIEPIKMLAEVIDGMDEIDIRLKLCAPEAEWLESQGIFGEKVDVQLCTRTETMESQQNADILFLPLAFDSSNIELQTAFPTKTLEYLISGTPILVCAPPNFYISECARKEEWGFVVDRLDQDSLKKGILRLLKDKELRKRLVKNAKNAAVPHDAERVLMKLHRYLTADYGK